MNFCYVSLEQEMLPDEIDKKKIWRLIGFGHVHGRNTNKSLVTLKRRYIRKSCFESSIIELFKFGSDGFLVFNVV